MTAPAASAVDLHVRHWGGAGAPPALLVHGMVVAGASMAPLAELLSPHLLVAAPDQPGYGESPAEGVAPEPGPLARALVPWLASWAPDGAVLVAVSFGCQVATEVAMRRPDLVRRLVLASPTVDPTARSVPAQLRLFRHEAATHSAGYDRLVRRDYAAAGVRRAVATLRAAVADRVEERLPFVGVPTLVVRGTDDPMVSAAWAAEVEHLLPQGRLVTVQAPHAMAFDGAGALADAALPFLLEQT